MSATDYYVMVFGFGIFTLVLIYALWQRATIRKKSNLWAIARGEVLETRSYEGSFEQDLLVKYTLEGIIYEEWPHNAFSVITRDIRIGDVIDVKVNPINPKESVLLPVASKS